MMNASFLFVCSVWLLQESSWREAFKRFRVQGSKVQSLTVEPMKFETFNLFLTKSPY